MAALALSERTRWSSLQLFGTSLVVRSTVLVPLVGYLILLNDRIVEWMNIGVPWLPDLEPRAAGWRLFFIFYGGMLVGLGSVIFSWRCPRPAKKYRSVVEYVSSEREFFWPGSHYTYLVARLQHLSRELKTWQKGAHEFFNLDRELAMARSQEGREDAKDHLIVLMTLLWHIEDTCQWPWRCVVFALFAVGSVLILVPSIATVVQITLATVRYVAA